MGKKDGQNDELFDMLRATGIRKKLARRISVSTTRTNDDGSRVVLKTAQGLRAAAAALEDHVPGSPKARAPEAGSTATSAGKRRSAGMKKAASRSTIAAKKRSAGKSNANTAPRSKKAAERRAGARKRSQTRARSRPR